MGAQQDMIRIDRSLINEILTLSLRDTPRLAQLTVGNRNESY